jgi:hypothetical protein
MKKRSSANSDNYNLAKDRSAFSNSLVLHPIIVKMFSLSLDCEKESYGDLTTGIMG